MIFGFIVIVAVASVTIGYFVVSARDTPEERMRRSGSEKKKLVTGALPMPNERFVAKVTRPGDPSQHKGAQESLISVLKALQREGVEVTADQMLKLSETTVRKVVEDASAAGGAFDIAIEIVQKGNGKKGIGALRIKYWR